MSKTIEKILTQESFSKEDLVMLLSADEEARKLVFAKGEKIKEKYVGNKVYYRGLIEFSNLCGKNCYYCGIRAETKKPTGMKLQSRRCLKRRVMPGRTSLAVL